MTKIANVNLVVCLARGAQKILERALFPAVPVSAPDSKVKKHSLNYFVGGLKFLSADKSHGAESLGKDFSRRVLVPNAKIFGAGRLCAEIQI